MLTVGDKVLHYVDDIEGYRMFEVMSVDCNNRCTLSGLDTNTQLSRVLDNSIPNKVFNYIKVD